MEPDPRTLAADLYDRHRRPLAAALRRRFPSTDSRLRYDALIDAILYAARHPERLDPDRGSPAAFLFAIACRKVLDGLRKASRRERESRKPVIPVTELPAAARSPGDELADRETAAAARDALARTEEERTALDLWLLDADYPDYADRLALGARPEDEGRAYVERLLARLRQRLHRYRQRTKGQEDEP